MRNIYKIICVCLLEGTDSSKSIHQNALDIVGGNHLE